MTSNPNLFACLLHLAHADGFLFDDEIEYLKGVMDKSHIAQVDLFHDPKEVDYPRLRQDCPDPGSRKEFLRLVYELTHLDGQGGEEEWRVVRQILDAFDLPLRSWGELRQWLGILL